MPLSMSEDCGGYPGGSAGGDQPSVPGLRHGQGDQGDCGRRGTDSFRSGRAERSAARRGTMIPPVFPAFAVLPPR